MSYLKQVDIRMGSKSEMRFSNGNTLPFTQLPWAMAGFVPQTSSSRGNWFYNPEDRSIEGIRMSHQASPWVNDYGQFTFMPYSDYGYFANPDDRWSGYRPENAVLCPDYQRIEFLRYRSIVELTPSLRGAKIKAVYQDPMQPGIGIFPVNDRIYGVIEEGKNQVSGYVKTTRCQVHESFAMYFVMQFDRPIDRDKSRVSEEGIFIGLETEGEVHIDLAVSYISTEQAVRNLELELAGRSFEEIRRQAREQWEDLLGKIEIETEDAEQKRIFYSCLYRMFLFPHTFHECGANGKTVHYCPHDGQVREGILYTNSGFWDTFRTVYPLYALLVPEKYAEILQGFVNFYKDCGWLPKWPAPAELGMMPGTLIDAVIADAAVKGIAGQELLRDAFEGMLKHAQEESADGRYGRRGTKDYERFGYIPRELHGESVNHTLDYVYGDFCIARTAEVLGEVDIARRYDEKAQNYRKIFDPESGFMRGRDSQGQMADDFDPYVWGGEYTEGSAWQNSFSVYHDIDGLMELHGGKEAFVQKLDELFHAETDYRIGSYGREIHEMTEMAAADFGQCAISNQPSFHIPYLYAAAGVQEKTDDWVERIAGEGFSSQPDGYPGDEDNGSLSGWYVFSTLGMYPLCPGKTGYLRSKPLVSKAVLHTPEADFTILAKEHQPGVWDYQELMTGNK